MIRQKITMSRDSDIQTGVEIVEKSTGLVKWGQNNLYGQYLNFLYYTCAVHQGIINRKIAFILGQGLKEGSVTSETIKMFKPLLRGLILNNEISDSYYIEMRLDYTSKSRIERIKLIPFEQVRALEDGSFQICENWTDNKLERKTLRTFKNREEEDQSFIFVYKTQPLQYLIGGEGNRVSKSYYTEPNYSGGIKSILTDIEAVNYQFSSFRNSFAVGTIVNMNNGNVQNPDDKRDIIEEIQDSATGGDNASSVLVYFNNGKETEVTVQQLSGDQLHERYSRMSEDVRDNILKAHGVVSPSLFGFQAAGSFNQSEMEVAYLIMKDDYFSQRQDNILEAVNFVDRVNSGEGNAEFDNFNPLFDGKGISEFSSKKKEIDFEAVFSKYGKIIDKESVLFTESLNLDEPFKEVFSKKQFSAINIQVLNLINDGNTFDKIYKSLGINPLDLTKIYNTLITSELITNTGEVTRSGKLEIVKSDVSKYEIRYSYAVKAGYGADIIKGTRDFCRTVIGLVGRMYSREDITKMSTALGLDSNELWRYRGGWYHNPNTKKNEPSCRHEWKQSLVYIN